MWKKLFNKYKLKSLVCILFLIIETLADVFQPAFMALMINEGVQNKNLDIVFKYGLWMILIALIGAVGAVFRNILSSQISYHFGADLRSLIYKKIIYLKKSSYDKFSEGSLMTLVTSDTNKIQQFVQGILRIFLKAPLMGVGSIIMTIYIHPAFAGMYLFLFPFVVILITLNIKYGYPMFLKIQAALDKLNSRVQGLLAGIRVVKAFNQFDKESNKFDIDARNLRQISQKTHETLAVFPALLTLSIRLSIVYILWQANSWIQMNQMAVGDMMALVNYQFQVLFAVIILARVFTRFVAAKASFIRIEDLFKHDTGDETGQVIESLSSIHFDKVTFDYPDGTRALTDLSLTIEKNSMVGIIGPTGAGKSSLTDLLIKHYKASAGSIRIGNQCFDDLDKKSWRDLVALVPQKNTLFTGSIRDNISFGKDYTDESILKAAEEASILDFVTEHGLDAIIGRDGVNVSGGQKQRLSIARALVNKPALLILDDSTSAVDVITEKKIKANLKKDDMTVVLIAQRISSIMDADHIIVLEDGHLKSQGKHVDLLQSSDLYREIFESQLGSEVLL